MEVVEMQVAKGVEMEVVEMQVAKGVVEVVEMQVAEAAVEVVEIQVEGAAAEVAVPCLGAVSQGVTPCSSCPQKIRESF
jgi:hypothetical protein